MSVGRRALPATQGPATSATRRTECLRRALIACGVTSSLLYLVMDMLLSRRYVGYQYANQAVSELNADGAPTRTAFVGVSIAYNAMLFAFAVGVWLSTRDRQSGRVAAAMLAVSALVGQLTPLVFPMDQRGTDATGRGAMHGPMTLVASVFIMLAIFFAAPLHRKRFRAYSYATIAALLAFGGLTALYIPRLSAGDSTPGMGLVERANIYAYLAWVAALAISLSRLHKPEGKRREAGT